MVLFLHYIIHFFFNLYMIFQDNIRKVKCYKLGSRIPGAICLERVPAVRAKAKTWESLGSGRLIWFALLEARIGKLGAFRAALQVVGFGGHGSGEQQLSSLPPAWVPQSWSGSGCQGVLPFCQTALGLRTRSKWQVNEPGQREVK